ncbi:major facilitator superfamily domain-containing protein 6 [Phymastichus coffea]|uniref:major facilitator superfamily domain-containing protein 6 n=1 Tax=Phymastichus coffea TaxID=108790 RepID=UPI00273B711B|nr:major facilitator superfamily domain-containing protein 6 [Phymastichus coffea]XP_058803720.1 major facilitator superfamily domain-containing protein 6 [Phymastichus coffea]XP_058803721.1 major facilitator superfamily domain-containing protein 6 [Phymastichus coffea]XP_058803722.1 major facilitator superfamily domain-containing protein 6 [Phymastichus coffea]XP_058803723.1 major facilitator superfamily domain-containing protein 6 [Phymastichus coffea]XP_058803724.1 major facilitator superfa
MGKVKINPGQLPVKAHFFFFMAAMGPILPFLPVYGKQLGVSALVMGSITAVLPLLFLVAKPAFGFVVDKFREWRRGIFIALLAATSGCYILMYFLPALPGPVLPDNGKFFNVSCAKLVECSTATINVTDSCVDDGRSSTCKWQCRDSGNFTADVYFHADLKTKFEPDTSCFIGNLSSRQCRENDVCDVTCNDSEHESACVYGSVTFWGFVLLMSLGNIGFNVSNCISDAICFDVLGEGGQMSYGRQRVWGSIGFGIAALMSGYAVDWWSSSDTIKSYTPAFVFISAFTLIDLGCCSKLQLPIISGTDNILKDVYKLIKIKPIAIFLCFATLAGILDSFIIYFLFWYLEDLALATGHMHDIKLIEGLTVFAETLGGEVIFFTLSGKILKKIGYGYTFVFCFVCYALRLGLISLAPTPYWVVLIEFFMQGPTYALCYTTIVAYASVVAPSGTSATVQGIVAGMDDGLGFAVGSLIGGILYKEYGGVLTLRMYSSLALITAIAYFIVHTTYLKHVMPETNTRKNVEWKSPEDALKACEKLVGH